MSFVVGLLLVGHAVAVFVDEVIGHGRFPGSEPLVRLLNMDDEQTIPAWWSASMLLGCAAAAGIIASVQRRRMTTGDWRYWAGLAIALAFLSLDESSAVHEDLSRPVTRALDLHTSDWQFWSWTLPYLLLATLFCAVYWRFVKRLPSPIRRLLSAGGGTFVLGAAGVELAGARLWELDRPVSYMAVVALEETLEMVGIVIVAYALLTYLAREIGQVCFVASGEGRR